ncbi:AMP-binding protein, partial [Luteibacter sp. ME-Dv--P-043b]|uniref:non-ribosomal peptide synthetase n=1 Tax=Luteibacter sp. ME-Dv--P-043b TaxID=3040291 RepID=UPI002553E190
TSVAGRQDDALVDLVGFFSNTLVLRTDTSGNPRFRDLVRRARQADLDAFQHQDLPFDRLVEVLNPARSAGFHPLAQVMVGLQNNADATLALHDLVASPHALNAFEIAKFDLTFNFLEQADNHGERTLAGVIEYATDLFDEATVARMAQRLSRLLEEVAIEPDRRLDRIDLLEAHERRTLLLDWNDTATDLAATTVTAAFERQARRVPDAVALVCGDRQLTYAQLEDRANRLAHHLLELGAGSDVLVAVCMARSIELPVVLLGVLKAGAAFLPIDPAYPTERLAAMLQESMAPILVTTAEFADRLPSHWGSLLVLEEAAEDIARQPASSPTITPHPDHLAYVIYTSGSTGIPKGVAITHDGLSRSIRWIGGHAAVDGTDTVLARASVGFDAFQWELWLALLSGATACLLPEEATYDVEHIAACCDQAGVTVAVWPPSMLPALLDALERPTLRHVFSAGEALSTELVQAIARRWPIGVTNLYGPTEATIQATCYPVDLAGLDRLGATVPIGRPIDDTRLYVLDTFLQPVPVGVPGELY